MWKIVLLLSLLSSSVLANNASDSLFTMSLAELSQVQVVTAATGFKQKVNEAPASVLVINAEQWQARGANTLIEALRGTIGVEIDAVRVGISQNKITIRGLSGEFGQQVKILVDGVAINRLHNGGPPSSPDLSLSGYQRIEIVRSPGSVVFGADAFAGVINLVSYDIGEQPIAFSTSIGSFDSYNIAGASHLITDDWSFQISGEYQHYGDDKNRIVQHDLQATFDDFFGTNASLAPSAISNSFEQFTINSKFNWQNLTISYFGMSGDFGFGGGVANSLDPLNQGKQDLHTVKFDYDLSDKVDGDIHLTTWYKYQNSSFPFTIFPPGTVLPLNNQGNLSFTDITTFATFTDGYIGHPGNKDEQYHVNLSHLYRVTDEHKIRWELGIEHQKYTPYEKKNFGPSILDGTETVVDGSLYSVTGTAHLYANKSKREFFFFSLQDEWQVSDSIAVNLGARYDKYSDFGATINPRMTFDWLLSEQVKFRLFAGSAFRAPSFIDLTARNNPAGLGNPNLEPEKIKTYEASLFFEFNAQLHSNLTLFSYKAKKLIEFVPEEISGNAIAENIGFIETNGLEWQIQWRPTTKLDITANYTFLDTENDVGDTTPYIAKKLAALNINWVIATNFQLNLSNNWVIDRDRAITDQREKLASYLLSDARLNYSSPNTNVDLALIIKNFTDDKNSKQASSGAIPDDFPMAGRQVIAEISYKF